MLSLWERGETNQKKEDYQEENISIVSSSNQLDEMENEWMLLLMYPDFYTFLLKEELVYGSSRVF